MKAYGLEILQFKGFMANNVLESELECCSNYVWPIQKPFPLTIA
jgi:hypothetical protein